MPELTPQAQARELLEDPDWEDDHEGLVVALLERAQRYGQRKDAEMERLRADHQRLRDAVHAHRKAWSKSGQYGWADQNYANDALWAVLNDGR